jgi:hypothetical protein
MFNINLIHIQSQALIQACSTSYAVRETLAKFGLQAGNMQFNTNNAK